ncbi:MAG: hypothetical protein AB7F19_07065 [Candidatus Babeliales bacterium]
MMKNRSLFLAIALLISTNVYCMQPAYGVDFCTWYRPEVSDARLHFYIPENPGLVWTGQEKKSIDVHDVTFYPKDSGNLVGFNVDGTDPDKIAKRYPMPHELAEQLLRDGMGIYCNGYRLFAHAAFGPGEIKMTDAAYVYMGHRMIALALAWGADPLHNVEAAKSAMSTAWITRNAPLVQLLLSKKIPIPIWVRNKS